MAAGVAEHLNLDMPRLLDELLDEDPVVGECVTSLGAAGGEAFGGGCVVVGDAQALAAASSRRFDHDGITDRPRDCDRVIGGGDGLVVAGNRVDPGLLGQLLGRDLVAHGGHGIMLRPDEDDAGCFQRSGKLGVFGEEPVARMNRLGAGLVARGDDLLRDQVRFPRRRRADANRLVGRFDVLCVLVGLGVDSNGLDAHLAGGCDDPAGDFTAVGNEDFSEHIKFRQQKSLSGCHSGAGLRARWIARCFSGAGDAPVGRASMPAGPGDAPVGRAMLQWGGPPCPPGRAMLQWGGPPCPPGRAMLQWGGPPCPPGRAMLQWGGPPCPPGRAMLQWGGPPCPPGRAMLQWGGPPCPPGRAMLQWGGPPCPPGRAMLQWGGPPCPPGRAMLQWGGPPCPPGRAMLQWGGPPCPPGRAMLQSGGPPCPPGRAMLQWGGPPCPRSRALMRSTVLDPQCRNQPDGPPCPLHRLGEAMPRDTRYREIRPTASRHCPGCTRSFARTRSHPGQCGRMIHLAKLLPADRNAAGTLGL